MTQTIRVDKITPTKSAVFNRVYHGETGYSYNKKDITLVVGETYDIETKSDVVGDKTWYTITSARKAAPQRANGTDSTGSPGVAPWYMNFVSNVVAHVIEAQAVIASKSGAVEDLFEPQDLKQWALAAKRAAEACLADKDYTDDPFAPDTDLPPVE